MPNATKSEAIPFPLRSRRTVAASGGVTVDLVNTIGLEIVAGIHEPGAILPNEAETSARFGVGRSAVREAVKMLTAKGLLDTRPRRGTQIRPVRDWNLLDADVLYWLRQTPPDRAKILELIELRLGFEPEAAALAARKGNPAHLARIRTAYEMMERSADGSGDPVEADCQFHEAILVATENRFYQPLASLVRTALPMTAPITNALLGHSAGDLEAHYAILVAIEEHRTELAHDRARAVLLGLVEAVERAEILPQARGPRA